MDDSVFPFEPITIPLGNDASLSFKTPDEVDQWINREQDAFKWLTDGGGAAGEQVAALRKHYLTRLNDLRRRFDELKANPNEEILRNQFANSLENFLSDERTIKSDHQFVRIASDVARTDGPVAASAAFGALIGKNIVPSLDTIKGVVGAIVRRDGLAPNSSQIVAKAIDDLNASNATTRSKQNDEWNALTEKARSEIESTIGEFTSRANTMTNGLNDSANETIRKIEATEANYRTQMQLQAPVEYWTLKAETHRQAIQGSRLRLIWFAATGSVALIGALLWLAINAVAYAEKASGDTAIYLKFAAIGAIVTTIIFWIGRVLLRIYLSDRHLLTDAEERVAMIKTYLALSNEGKVEAVDRALILAPIFKSASDGIVRDDGPDTSLGGVLAKLIDVKR